MHTGHHHFKTHTTNASAPLLPKSSKLHPNPSTGSHPTFSWTVASPLQPIYENQKLCSPELQSPGLSIQTSPMNCSAPYRPPSATGSSSYHEFLTVNEALHTCKNTKTQPKEPPPRQLDMPTPSHYQWLATEPLTQATPIRSLPLELTAVVGPGRHSHFSKAVHRALIWPQPSFCSYVLLGWRKNKKNKKKIKRRYKA